MTTTAASASHWHFPGWRALAVSVVLGVALALLGGLFVEVVHPTPTVLARAPTTFLFTSMLFVPAEEWLFRGVLLRWLRRWTGLWPALLVSASAFALVHGDLPRFLPRFVAGLVLGLVYIRTGSLWPCMVAHYVHNATLVSLVLSGIILPVP